MANDTKVKLLINLVDPDSQCTTTCMFAEITAYGYLQHLLKSFFLNIS
jgi:hypothetical protein